MKYTKEEKLNIGRRIYTGEITRNQAAEEYDIGEYTARDYMRMYRDVNNLPPKAQCGRSKSGRKKSSVAASCERRLRMISELEEMTKEELIRVILKSGMTEKRLKKLIE